jgi:hypothetical protein
MVMLMMIVEQVTTEQQLIFLGWMDYFDNVEALMGVIPE